MSGRRTVWARIMKALKPWKPLGGSLVPSAPTARPFAPSVMCLRLLFTFPLVPLSPLWPLLVARSPRQDAARGHSSGRSGAEDVLFFFFFLFPFMAFSRPPPWCSSLHSRCWGRKVGLWPSEGLPTTLARSVKVALVFWPWKQPPTRPAGLQRPAEGLRPGRPLRAMRRPNEPRTSLEFAEVAGDPHTHLDPQPAPCLHMACSGRFTRPRLGPQWRGMKRWWDL